MIKLWYQKSLKEEAVFTLAMFKTRITTKYAELVVPLQKHLYRSFPLYQTCCILNSDFKLISLTLSSLPLNSIPFILSTALAASLRRVIQTNAHPRGGIIYIGVINLTSQHQITL